MRIALEGDGGNGIGAKLSRVAQRRWPLRVQGGGAGGRRHGADRRARPPVLRILNPSTVRGDIIVEGVVVGKASQ